VRLVIQYGALQRLLRLIGQQKDGYEVTDADIEAVLDEPEYPWILKRHEWVAKNLQGRETAFPLSELRRVFKSFFSDDGAQDFAGYFDRLLTNLKSARTRYEETLQLVEALGAIRSGDILARLEASVPKLPDVDGRVIVALEAHSNAYAHEGVTVISFSSLTMDEQGRVTMLGPCGERLRIENVIGHELHHVVFGSLMKHVDSPEDEAGWAGQLYKMYAGLLGEGLATYLFSEPGHEELDCWRPVAAGFARHLNDFGRLVVDAPSTNVDSLTTRAFGRFFEPEAPSLYPAVYVMGYEMCKIIESEFGRDRLVATMLDPMSFIELYQEAARLHGAPLVEPEAVSVLVNLGEER